MGQKEGASGFKGWLERGLGSGELAGGSSIAERMEQRVEAQVMGRVRGLGSRTSSTDERNERSGPRANEARPERGAAEAQRAERAAEERPVERSNERDEQSQHTRDDAGGAARTDAPHEAPRARSLEGGARSLQAADAAVANSAEGPAPDGVSHSGASFAPAVQSSVTEGPGTAASAAQASGALPTGAMPAVGTATSNTSANTLPGIALDGPRATTGSKGATATEAAPLSAPAEDLELAEKVMHQLRARLQLGQREALIELRPSELGRIGVHLRFEDGALTATIRAERPETLAVLEAHAPELRAWLAQDGAEVREIDLGLAERGALFDKPQQRQHERAVGRRSGVSAARERDPEAVQALTRTNTNASTPGVDVPSVDIFV